MRNNAELLEKYMKEMLEMRSRASLAQPEVSVRELKTDDVMQQDAAGIEEEVIEEIIEETAEMQSDEQTDEKPPVCSVCAGGIALCEFFVEDSKRKTPIEFAQILISGKDGFFIRALTDENGKTTEIPLFTEESWQVSISAQGYVCVSKAEIAPLVGEKNIIPVKLDESISISGIFAESQRA